MNDTWQREAEWLDRVRRWIALHPVTGSPAALALASEIRDELSHLGFSVEERVRPGHAPLLVARRPAPPGATTIGMYGHYDVEPVHGVWKGDALQLRVEGGRAFGRGIADNLGPLAQRMIAAREVRRWPGVLWVLEGEEETGSTMLAELLAALRNEKPLVWIDETGYFEAPNRQRILAARSDSLLETLCTRLRDAAVASSISVTFENRMLNRASTSSAVGELFAGLPYLSFGPNDERSNVHGIDESLPLSTLGPSARQFTAILEALA